MNGLDKFSIGGGGTKKHSSGSIVASSGSFSITGLSFTPGAIGFWYYSDFTWHRVMRLPSDYFKIYQSKNAVKTIDNQPGLYSPIIITVTDSGFGYADWSLGNETVHWEAWE